MQVIFKKILPLLVAASAFTTQFVFADPFTSFFKFSELTGNAEKTEVATPATTTVEKVVKAKEEVATETPKTSCEYYDSTTDNVMILETASADAKQKIDNVEDTIDNETAIRDSIFDSVKSFLGLQKKDKVIFREMRKDISDARGYYDDLDQKIVDTNDFLLQNPCEVVKVESAKKVDDDTVDLVEDESTYRKQFVASLKEKMKILQNGIQEAKR
jgi:hypothetical protein